MAEATEPGRKRRSGAALPLTLLALFLAAVGAAALWASLAPEPAPLPLSIALTPEAPAPAAEVAEPAPVAPAIPPALPPPAVAPPPVAAPPPAVAPSEAVPPPPAAEPQHVPPPQSVERPSPPRALPAPPPAPAIKPAPISKSGALAVAPDPALIQKTPEGPLPIIAPDGRRAWQVYARPFEAGDKRPRIAILVTGLGTSDAATEAAIQGLPGAVTLAFWPYSERLDHWIQLARAAGHEVLLNLPMEPENYPNFDPGPKTLLTSLSPEQNLERLEWALSRVTGYVGVVDFQGSRFTTSRRDLEPVLETLNRRGLIFVDSRATPRSLAPQIAYLVGLPWASNSRFLDNAQVSRAAIDARLRELETIARADKRALGIGAPYPVTLERINAWVTGLAEKGIALAPVTAVLEAKPQE
jgi:polysaccharide deacetylase 2 family uncharacterized protein YibQ